MALTYNQTVDSYFRPLNKVHYVNSGEAGSGEIILPVFANDSTPTVNVGIHANVTAADGTVRVLTKKLYSTVSGVADIAGTGFVAGDTLTLLAFKYYI